MPYQNGDKQVEVFLHAEDGYKMDGACLHLLLLVLGQNGNS